MNQFQKWTQNTNFIQRCDKNTQKMLKFKFLKRHFLMETQAHRLELIRAHLQKFYRFKKKIDYLTLSLCVPP